MTKQLVVRISIFLLPFLLIVSPNTANAEHVTGADVINCGEIIPPPPVGAQDEPQTVHGYVSIMGELETPKFKPGCTNVVAKIDVHFGLQIQINGSPDFQIVKTVTRVTHPPMTNPETGVTSTVDQWDSPMNIGYARFAGWVFEEPWELLPGRWIIEVLYEDQVLASREFNVKLAE